MKRHPVSPTNEHIVNALVGYDKWLTTTSEDAETIIELLTDDDDMGDYIKLPKDVDGEVIHIGDVMTVYGCHTFIVDGIGFVDGNDVVYYTTNGGRRKGHLASVCHHYHKPTVEDILGEFAIACEDAGNGGPTVAALIDEYAKRIREAEW